MCWHHAGQYSAVQKVQAALDKALGITRENPTGSRVIRAFNKEQDEIAQFHEDNEALTKIQPLCRQDLGAHESAFTYIIINGAIVVLVWVGAIRVDNGNITQGQVVALVSYMSQILVELIAGQPDYQHQQIHCLHEPYRDCA